MKTLIIKIANQIIKTINRILLTLNIMLLLVNSHQIWYKVKNQALDF